VIKKKHTLSLAFCLICASLSAFLDALTLVAVAIAVCFNFYAIYHRVESHSGNEKEMEEFRGFLRNLIVHGICGTIMGGTMTIVGEPNNMMIGTKMGWDFMGFVAHCAIISVPAAIAGLIVCFSLEYFHAPGFRYQMPERARELIQKDYAKKMHEMTEHNVYVYIVQVIVLVMLVLALALHLAEVGLIGIGLIIIVTAFTGLTKEHDLGGAFTNAMPFAMLIVVFFAILGVAHEQHLVTPLADWVFTFSGDYQHLALYFTNGTLSLVSDNVFIATVFINEVESAYAAGIIAQMLQNINIEEACANGNVAQTFAQYLASLPSGVLEDSDIGIREIVAQLGNRIETAYVQDTIETPFSAFISSINAEYAHKTIMSREEYDKLGVVVNMGTNIPAMATPNGHATLLFLLTSSLAPVLRLSYFRLVILTLPYTIAMTITGALAIYFFL
jgi:NhaB family Na+:H+ antiporter